MTYNVLMGMLNPTHSLILQSGFILTELQLAADLFQRWTAFQLCIVDELIE